MYFAVPLWKVHSLDKGIRVEVSAGACILLALMLLLLPLRWLLAAIVAAAVHEGCHALAVVLFGGRLRSVQITAGGAKMDASPVGNSGEIICALAGPAGGLLLLFLVKWFPRTALCAAIQSAWNLLPIYPLDGGRALQCIATLIISPDKADIFCRFTERVCIAVLVLIGIYGSVVLHLGLLPLFPGVISLMHTKYGKTPCKQGLKRVQ